MWHAFSFKTDISFRFIENSLRMENLKSFFYFISDLSLHFKISDYVSTFFKKKIVRKQKNNCTVGTVKRFTIIENTSEMETKSNCGFGFSCSNYVYELVFWTTPWLRIMYKRTYLCETIKFPFKCSRWLRFKLFN